VKRICQCGFDRTSLEQQEGFIYGTCPNCGHQPSQITVTNNEFIDAINSLTSLGAVVRAFEVKKDNKGYTLSVTWPINEQE
jgi:hypothetical protein